MEEGSPRQMTSYLGTLKGGQRGCQNWEKACKDENSRPPEDVLLELRYEAPIYTFDHPAGCGFRAEASKCRSLPVGERLAVSCPRSRGDSVGLITNLTARNKDHVL